MNPSDPLTVGFDDLVTADGPVSDFHQAPAPANVFRVMSLDVKRRRVGTELVVEHSKAIGVVPLRVVLKDNENRQLFVESQCADQDLSAHSISMEHLVRMGMHRLKSKTCKTVVNDTVAEYQCVPVWQLLAGIVNSGAFPPGDTHWTAPSHLGAVEQRALQSWQDWGLLELSVRHSIQRWQITELGIQCLKSCQACAKVKALFKRRPVDDLQYYTVWELVDMLIADGWTLVPIQARVKR